LFFSGARPVTGLGKQRDCRPAVIALIQSISNPPTQAPVQAIQKKLNELITTKVPL
jgi:hypothetical protein